MYTNVGESGLSSPAVVNDVVFCSTSKVSLYAFKVDDGTLLWQDVMNDRALLRSKAAAGTMTTASGRKLVFALFVNDVPLPKGVTSTREGKVLGTLCEVIYQHAH